MGVLFRRTLAANRVRLLACAIGLFVWGMVLPMVYASFGETLGRFARGNPLIEQFSRFGGGDLFSLPGAMALGFIHPIAIALLGVVVVGLPILSIAGERQRGTLEVLLARPISRHTLYVVVFAVGALLLAILVAVQLLAMITGAAIAGVLDELMVERIPFLWFAGWLLAVAIMAVGFAASVSFDRVMPALGVTLVIVLVSYLFEVVGSLWPEAAWLSDYSLFHYVRTKLILEGELRVADVAVIAGVLAIAVGYAWLVFPRRDIAAPS